MSNLSLNIAVEVLDPQTQLLHYARIKVPSNLPRFISLPNDLKTVGNELVDWVGVTLEDLITHNLGALFYEASQAGVEIDLIIRGICCLKPGIEGISENIRVVSIIGRFLEHSRIFYFQNDGNEKVFIGSADWMPRNLDRRVEAVVPVEEPAYVKELKELLNIFMADNRQAWDMQSDGSYLQRQPASGESERSAHMELMQRAVEQADTRV